ncbi:hypothetical protein GBA52_009488 [Prunus armeniaca]|nr:hypothetical protein GBA52_009488 [Prunus armeniaca]
MAEKVNFAQTCNRLSQYLKEKRSLQVPTTMNLLTNMETSPAAETPSSKPSIDLFPQFAKNPEAVLANQPGSAQMTIFYGGQVLVFNDLQAEKAREIMGLATKGSSKIYSGFANCKKSFTSQVSGQEERKGGSHSTIRSEPPKSISFQV